MLNDHNIFKQAYHSSMEDVVVESNNDLYKWSDINSDLMQVGINPKQILKVDSALKNKPVK